jgi:two-component system, LytTR family, response regulator
MGMLISVLIIDDDDSARNILLKFLDTDERVFVIDCLSSTKGALELIESEEPDAIFLDINMPQEDGLEFASRLRNSTALPKVIFTTAYRQYAFEAFGLKPFYFLTKPFGLIDIQNLISSIAENIEFEEKEQLKLVHSEMCIHGKLKLQTKNGYLFIEPKNIVFISSVLNHSEFLNVNGECVMLHSKLIDIQPFLKFFNFIRINRSTLANIQYIIRVERKKRICVLRSCGVEYNYHISRSSLRRLEEIGSIKLG